MLSLSNYRVAVLTMLLAGLLLAASGIVANWHNWESVSFAISLHENAITSSPRFEVETSTEYLIDLDVDRRLPFNELNCLLGLGVIAADGCGARVSPLDLEWRLMAAGKPVIYGDSRNSPQGAWGRAISRTIGRFNGEPGTTYMLEVESRRDASVLDSTYPRVVVRAQPLSSKTSLVAGQGVGTAGVALLAVAVGLFIVRWKDQRASRTSQQ